MEKPLLKIRLGCPGRRILNRRKDPTPLKLSQERNEESMFDSISGKSGEYPSQALIHSGSGYRLQLEAGGRSASPTGHYSGIRLQTRPVNGLPQAISFITTEDIMAETAISEKIDNFIKSNRVMLFMKGEKQEPMCGFSAQVLHILNDYGIEYTTENVLANWDLREGIKEYSNWPTIPQLYVDGQFIGGCDIVMELHRKGELDKLLGPGAAS